MPAPKLLDPPLSSKEHPVNEVGVERRSATIPESDVVGNGWLTMADVAGRDCTS